MPHVAAALRRFEPAVLLTADGLGAIHAPQGDDEAAGRALWFMADTRTVLDWESSRRQVVTLTFHSPDDSVYLSVSGKAEVVTDGERAATLWRPVFKRWFPRGSDDPRLLLVRFTVYDAEFYASADGQVCAQLAH